MGASLRKMMFVRRDPMWSSVKRAQKVIKIAYPRKVSYTYTTHPRTAKSSSHAGGVSA